MNKVFNYSFSVCASFFLILSLNVISQEIEEVVVTATKKDESVQDLAISIEAFTSDMLESNMIQDASDLQEIVPGLAINKGLGSGVAYSIRGVGSYGIGAAVVDAIIVSTNGHDSGTSSFADTGFFDVAQVEVLKGPQGTISGRNAVGGLINIVTNRPTSELEGSFDVDFGNYDSVRSNLVLNLPLSDRISTRLALTTNDRNGFTTNMRTGQKYDDADAYGGRFSLDFEISDTTLLKFTTDFYSADDNRSNVGTSFCTPHALLGCDPFQRGLIGTSSDARGSTAAVFNFAMGLEGTAFVNSYAGVPIYNDFEKSYLSRVPEHESRYSFTQLELEHDINEQLLLKVKASHQTRFYYGMNDNDYSHPIRQYPGILNGTPFFPDVIEFTRTWGGTDHAGRSTYGFTELTDRDATYEFANADFNSNQFEINLISNYDGPLNFTVGLYQYDSRSHNRYQVQTSSWGMGSSFSLHPYSQLLYGGTGAFNNYGGLDFYQTWVLGGLAGSTNCTALAGMGLLPPAAAAGTTNASCLGALLQGGGVTPNYVPTNLSGFINDDHIRTKSTALLGEIYYDLSEQTKLTVGFRYNEDTVMDNLMSCLWLTNCDLYMDAVDAGTIAPQEYRYFPTSVLVEDDAFAYKLALQHNISDTQMVYGSISTATKAGGNNPTESGIPDPYDPEETTNTEIGIKSLLFGGKMLFNSQLFFTDTKGMLIPTTENAGAVNYNVDTEVYGFEGNMIAFISETASIDISWLLVESEIVGDQTMPDNLNPLGVVALLDVNPALYTPGVGCATATGLCAPTAKGAGVEALPADAAGVITYGYGVLPDGSVTPIFKSAGYICDTTVGFNPLRSQDCTTDAVRANIKGKKLIGMPDQSYSIGFNNEFVLENGYLSARLLYKYTGERFGEIFNSRRSSMPESKHWDLSFKYTPNDGDWFVKAYVKNLADDRFIGLWSPASALQGGAQFGTYTDPRTYGVAFGSSF